MTLLQARLQGLIYPGGTPNDVENVFGYQSFLTITNELQAFTDNFLANVLPPIMLTLHVNYIPNKLTVIDVNDPARFLDTTGLVGSGARTGDQMPQFVGWGYQYTRGVRGQSSGRKCFGPISESDVSNGLATGTVLPFLTALNTTLAQPLQVGLVDTWFPIILSRPNSHHIDWQAHPIAGVLYRRVTTQNSRKR